MSGKRTKAIRAEYRKLPLHERGKQLYRVSASNQTIMGNTWRAFKHRAVRAILEGK